MSKGNYMIIYVLYFCNFHGNNEYIGVFSTYERAQATIDGYHDSHRSQFTIEEEKLDDLWQAKEDN